MSPAVALPFAKKAIAITGAARGIGFAIARYLAERGANLALADVEREQLEASVKGLRHDFPDSKITSTVVNVCSSKEVDSWINDTVATFGELNGAVNNAGIMGKWGNIDTIEDEDWDRLMNINVGGVMRCIRAELKVLTEGGSIVNTSSVAGLKASIALAPYVTSKHAVIGLTKCAALEAAGKRIRVNAVCPGPIETPMLVEVMKGPPLPGPPIARAGKPEEVAALVGYLLGPESLYTTGACIPVDGGFVC
ncbi:3-oxoacyl-reductase [Mytilinidion resinicola]|uniref:3-oxoacyl-reductase n=1 Tax=Mytilinidion resinicola TaxID=574789 RepID=A0A6A6YYC5_9PEZI|nr:3-oxoacyl-reductase [Mytilinidion resinicola]KAF2813548.1 3-oxoacyl-reductase [Mytilinidion resinicola]